MEKRGPSPDERRPPAPRPKPNPLSLLGAGLELAGLIAVLALGGWWLDRRYGTLPLFTLIGAAVGIVGGLYNLWKRAKRFF